MGIRLLSPMRRRIWSPQHPQTFALKRTPEADAITEKNLKYAGWTEYFGSAQVDSRGWVIPDADPDVVPAGPNEVWK